MRTMEIITLNIQLQMNSALYNAGIITAAIFKRAREQIMRNIDEIERELCAEE